MNTPRPLPLNGRVKSGFAESLAPRQTVLRWADRADDLRTLATTLKACGWHHARLSADANQLDITGPSGIHITIWTGLERSALCAQLSLGWLGPFGVMTDARP